MNDLDGRVNPCRCCAFLVTEVVNPAWENNYQATLS